MGPIAGLETITCRHCVATDSCDVQDRPHFRRLILRRNRPCDFILGREDIVNTAIIAFGPDMVIGLGFDELGGDA